MMLKHRKNVYHHRSSAGDFLLNQAKPPAAGKASDQNALTEPIELSEKFPGFLTGRDFIEHAAEFLQTPRTFAAMAIRIDGFAPDSEPQNIRINPETIIHTACAVNSICRPDLDLWGRLNRYTFAAFLTGKNSASALKTADLIRQYMTQHGSETVSIGIAAYPTVNYPKELILENARKALDHASFYGHDSVTDFDATSLNISGDKFYQNGNIHGAVKEYETALMIDPDNVNVHNSLGVCYGELNRLTDAQNEFEEAVRLDGNEIMALYNAGLIHMMSDNFEQAFRYFQQAENIEKNIFELKFQIAQLYIKTGQADKAVPYLKQALDIKPESAPTYRYLGEAYIALKLLDRAVSAYKKAIKINPNDADSLSALSRLFDLRGENPEIVIMFCKKSIELSPSNGLFRYRLGGLYFKHNQPEKALHELKTAVDLGYETAADLISQIQAQHDESKT